MADPEESPNMSPPSLDGVGAGAAPPRRRLGAMLSAYYGIDGATPGAGTAAGSLSPASAARGSRAESVMDKQGFDAKAYFNAIVAEGQVADVLKRANELDEEVRDLDGDMQMVVHENYSKFIRATDVTKQVKTSIEGMKPDLRNLEESFRRIKEHQRSIDEGVTARGREVEAALKRQKTCQKLRILIDLPTTLQSCLDKGLFGRAVEAYCCCAPFLRQHRHLSTFHRVLEDVELQMGRIRSSLESRLRSPSLSAEDAVNSSKTLIDLGEDRAKVLREFLRGRAAALLEALDWCFAEASSREAGAADEQGQELRGACGRATERYVPMLSDAVAAFQRLQVASPQMGGPAVGEEALADFVNARIEDLCERVTRHVETRRPPASALVDCVQQVQESLQRLQSLLPSVLTRVFTAFLSRTADNAIRMIFQDAAIALVKEVLRLHEFCKRSEEKKASGLDSVLDEAGRVEQSLNAVVAGAVADCQPVLQLVGQDPANQQLVRSVQEQMTEFFKAFVDICHAYVGSAASGLEGAAHDREAEGTVGPSLSTSIASIADLEWVGAFCLTLFYISRRVEDKVMDKAWSLAREMCTKITDAKMAEELSVSQVFLKATHEASEALLTHYVLVSGQRLAHFFRNSLQKPGRDWRTAREPHEPSLVVEIVVKELHAFDTQLARVLADPRKPRGASHRRVFNRNKTSMELEMEREWARKLQVFAAIPFNRNGAVLGILQIAFKALCEYVREETFAKFGLQQVQVDAEFFSELVRDFVEAEDASNLGSLLGEVVDSASKRCVDPLLMEAAAVEAMCDRKKKSLRFD